jgi:hypothetical protein
MHDRAQVPIPTVVSAMRQGSVLLTGQVCSRKQRRGRYTKESFAHPGKMLPSIARYLIHTFPQPGEWVCDEARRAALAADNLRLAAAQGATGAGQIVQGDSRRLPALVPQQLHGRIALVITSPPYGPSTHGQARTPGPRRGKVRKINHQYGGPDNLAYHDLDHLAAGFAQILTGAAAILRPGGIVAVTARPYRRHGELVDIPGMVAATGINAGLRPREECAALIAGIRDGRLVPRASFFQQENARTAIAAGDPQWLLQHEDVVIFESCGSSASSDATAASNRGGTCRSPQRCRQ